MYTWTQPPCFDCSGTEDGKELPASRLVFGFLAFSNRCVGVRRQLEGTEKRADSHGRSSSADALAPVSTQQGIRGESDDGVREAKKVPMNPCLLRLEA
jgi:hypothetical protein